MAVIQTRPKPLAPEPHRRRVLEWLSTTDHKKIGILYLVNSFSFFVIAGIMALLMRSELARPGQQFLSAHAYNQVFTEHGTLMIFLFIFPTLAGFGNYFVPLQIGALDMAFPRVNALSFWLLPVGGLTIVSGFVAKGGAAAGGWTSFAPLSEQLGTGEDLWIAGLLLVGAASILGAINFIVTILRMRAPGMSMMRMPIFCWSTLATSLLVVLATPVITAGLIMLFADRHLGTTFFSAAKGGRPLYWQHVFWFFGHPEVYMLILAAWGIVSEILPVFSGKPLFVYQGVVLAFLLITALSLIGGIDGVWMAAPAMDFAIHDTYWVVAHFHYVLFGGTVFGIMAGIYYWFPKITGRMLSRRLGLWHFWLQLVGFNLTFFPKHMLGLQGMPRRNADYAPDRGRNTMNLLSTIGAFVIGLSMLIFAVNVILTLRKPRTAPADPWSGNTLEWATTSPPPPHNFDRLPVIGSARPVYDARLAGTVAVRDGS